MPTAALQSLRAAPHLARTVHREPPGESGNQPADEVKCPASTAAEIESGNGRSKGAFRPGICWRWARETLAEGDGRKALDLLRQAQHGDPAMEELPLLLFCACMQRARQLAEKGLAQGSRGDAGRCRPVPDLHFLPAAGRRRPGAVLPPRGRGRSPGGLRGLSAGPVAPRSPGRADAGGPARDPTVLAGPRNPRCGSPPAARRRAGPGEPRSHGRRGLGAGRRPAAGTRPALPVCCLAPVLQGHGLFRQRRQRGVAPDSRPVAGRFRPDAHGRRMETALYRRRRRRVGGGAAGPGDGQRRPGRATGPGDSQRTSARH